jgi:N,N'-diacetyllegionaminate synthase
MTACQIQIGGRTIGEGMPCFIVAEAGSNHNGNLDHALAIIDAAKQSQADAVKFQNFRAEKLYPRYAGTSDYLPVKKPIYDIMKGLEMPPEWIPVLANYCKARDLVFFSAPFDEESADMLEPYVSVYKIASYEITHAPLIRHIARKKKPVIISTGTADLAEVGQALEWCRAEGNRQTSLLQCTASYPAPLQTLNIRALVTMREAFGVPTGISDHSRDPLVGPMCAVALGANIIEKHFTLSNRLPGPDHAYALEPAEFHAMVEAVRHTEEVLGDGSKVTQDVERELHDFARRFIYATRTIGQGEKLTANNIAVLRSGKLKPGLAPKHWDLVLGRTARRQIGEGEPIDAGDCGIDIA